MVFVKVRETYDLHTVKDKMTVIAIHTPKPDIIKKNFPGLLLQCRAYRPVSANVRVACASVQSLDPLGVGTAPGTVSPEDMFNPILYKAMSNKGMSQLEARINLLQTQSNPGITVDVDGSSAMVEVDEFVSGNDDFPVYYGLLSNAHDWKHANPQAGLSMDNLRPFVYEAVYNIGDVQGADRYGLGTSAPDGSGNKVNGPYARSILGKAKEMPFINCTAYTVTGETKDVTGYATSGFPYPEAPNNCEVEVPWINVVCGAIIVPPSKSISLYYRMVCEWVIEFSSIRPIGEITDWYGLASIGNATHYQNYSYESTKEAITGDPKSMLQDDACMVSANVDVDKVM